MSNLRWFDSSQPQTLQGAVILMYITTVLSLLTLLGTFSIVTLLVLAQGAAAIGIANEKRWAYWLAVALATLSLGLIVLSFALGGFDVAGLLTISTMVPVAFAIVLEALLLHPVSRQYRRAWFR